MWSHFKGFLTPPIVIGTVAVLAVASVAVAYVTTSAKPSAAYVTPTTGSLVQEVDTTGVVDAADTINLGFQTGGAIANAGPQVGAHVAAGATLGTLSSASQQAAVEEAEAALETQQANLASLQAGATPEQVTVSQTGVSNAQQSIAQAEQSLVAVAQDAYAKSDAAIDNEVDQFMSNPHTSTPSLALTLSNSQDQASIVSGRLQMESLLNSWQQYLASLPSDPSQVDASALASTTRNNLEQVSSYLTLVATGLTEAIPEGSYTTATIQGYESDIATARTNVSADLTAIDSAETALTSAQSALNSAQSQLSVTTAPATQQQIEAQQGEVAAAQAQVDAAKAQLAETAISAPISGTITVNNMEPGQIATAGQTEISMISDSAFQFDTYVSESQLAEIQVGDQAQVELDAYQNQAPLSAHVIEINPAATVQNGVSSYEVKLQFDENDPRISAGATGSVKIITQSLTDVMSVPTSAIINDNGSYFVIVKGASGAVQEMPVQIGIQSAGGYTQITSGLSSTDQVQTFGNQ